MTEPERDALMLDDDTLRVFKLLHADGLLTGESEALRLLSEAPTDLHRALLRRASEIKPQKVRWAWKGFIPLKALSLVVGRWETSKTTLLTERTARLTRGQLEGDLRGQPCDVIVASAEDSPEITLTPRFIAAGADLERVHFITMPGEFYEKDLALPEHLEPLEYAMSQVGARVVFVDPLSAHLGADVDSHRDTDIRRVLGPLAHLADRTDSAIVGVVHINKTNSRDLFQRVSGSIGIGGAARSILVAEKDPREPEDTPKRVLIHGKCNVAPKAEPLSFKVESVSITTDDGEEIMQR